MSRSWPRIAAYVIAQFCLLFSGTPSQAVPITLTPSGTSGIEISFFMPAPLTIGQDAIQFYPSTSTYSGGLATTVSLFDGATLLGTGPGLAGTFARFSDAGSFFASSSIVVDFTSIFNQSIDGLVRFTVTQGQWSFDTDNLSGASFGCCGSIGGQNPVITGVTLIPEPSPALLLGSGLLWVARRGRRRS